jgi:hypothetical protein
MNNQQNASDTSEALHNPAENSECYGSIQANVVRKFFPEHDPRSRPGVVVHLWGCGDRSEHKSAFQAESGSIPVKLHW